MNQWIKKVYLNSPFWLKKVFANLEGIRRNHYRRSGSYNQYYNNIQIEKALGEYNSEKQIEKFNNLVEYVREAIPFYKEQLHLDFLNTINDIKKLPLTSKNIMKNNIEKFINVFQKNKLWRSNTSGSTGNPFSYYRDRNSMQYEYALYDKLYDYVAGNQRYNKARISGVNVIKVECRKPPFWYYIKVYNQLQCSAYHIDGETFKFYIDAFDRYDAKLGTGYAKSWFFLAQYMNQANYRYNNLKGIVTDSEGLSEEEKLEIEKAFNCPVYQTYGLSEVGMVAVQCEYGHYHIFSDRCYVEIIDAHGNVLEDGNAGEIVVTDLYSFDAPFIRYKTGDMGVLERRSCKCGWMSPYIKELYGRIEDYVVTKEGRRVTRLGHIALPAKGVIGMQLVQAKPGELIINVLPGESFSPDSMNEVIALAKDYLGNMDITWRTVENLEKTNAGKTKFIIRTF